MKGASLDVVAHVVPVKDACGAPKGSLIAGYVPTLFPCNWYGAEEQLFDIITTLGFDIFAGDNESCKDK